MKFAVKHLNERDDSGATRSMPARQPAARATGCLNCHDTELFTDLHSYNVGTRNPFDKEDKEFDTPTLRELWRTAPYLHDGSAATIRDVVTNRNPSDEHGKTSHLTPQQLDDLAEYLLSL